AAIRDQERQDGARGPAQGLRAAPPAPTLTGMAYRFYTIGHSTHPIEDFVARRREAQVACLVAVRTVPRSRTNPQYNRETLPQALAPFGIGYEHIAALGGLRGRKRDVPDGVNGFWHNASFHNYADYAMSDAFHAGLAHLRELGHA